MVFCPHCGDEVTEPVSYCPKCGELLETEVAERTTLNESIRYGIESLKNNPMVFAPELILTLASAIGGLLFDKLYGADVYLDLQEAILAGGDLTPYYPLFRVTAAYMVIGMVFDLLFQPFIQHIYLDVTRGDGVSFGRSFKNTISRLGEYIIAQLTVILIPVLSLGGIFMALGSGPMDEVPSWLGGAVLLMFVLTIGMYFISLGSQIMVWEGESFTKSIRLGFEFFKKKLDTLIGLTVVNIVIGFALMMLPYNTYYGFVLSVFNGIVTIDIYLNYRKKRI